MQSPGEKDWKTIDSPIKASPSNDGTTLNANYNYTRLKGSILSGGAKVYKGDFTFQQDGTYESSSSSFSGSGIISQQAGLNSFSETHCDASGGFSTTTTNIQSSRSDLEGCGDGKSGRYSIDGYTITLFANNGVNSRAPFYRHRDWVVVDSQHYSP